MSSRAERSDKPTPMKMRTHFHRLTRLRGWEVTPARFRTLALTSLGWIYLVITTGAVVRLTGSGLGCDHWPKCGDTPFPAKDGHAVIEFGNRVIGAITIGFTLLAWLAARRTHGLPRRIQRLALTVFLGTAAQIPLGGLTVIFELHPLLVMAHFLLALAMLGIAVVVAVEAWGFDEGLAPPLVPRELRLAGLVLAASGFVLVVSGAFATAAGPHAGDSSDIERLGTPVTSVAVHAVVSAVFGSAFLFVLGYLAARRDRSPRLLSLAVWVLALLLIQGAIGGVQYHTGLPWLLVLAHVAVASAVWGGVVALVTLMFRAPVSLRPNVH
jgi:cytochrome c oxidase assembly protein subunit 15